MTMTTLSSIIAAVQDIVGVVSGVTLAPETVDRLADLPGIEALKDATVDMEYGGRVAAQCGERLTVLSGQDGAALPLWAIGGRGVVSVVSNLVPAHMVTLWELFCDGDLEGAGGAGRAV